MTRDRQVEILDILELAFAGPFGANVHDMLEYDAGFGGDFYFFCLSA